MASGVATGVRPYGPRAAIVDCHPSTVIPLATALQATGMFREIVPAEVSVLVQWGGSSSLEDLQGVLDTVDISGAAPVGRLVEIPVVYDGEDLDETARLLNCSVESLIKMHSEPTYLAAFAGFAPGFMYCTGLPEQLRIPRRATPRKAVPKGSVAIADVYTAVYPVPSPGGWNLLGHTDLEMFDLQSNEPSRIKPGDRVRFLVRNS